MKLNNAGQYLSVDGRPLSTQIGAGQAIAKTCKTYVRAAVSKNDMSAKITDPFCCLQLKCPKGSYDANIEPGKDDVLFGDRNFVISLVERLLTEHYGPLVDGQKTVFSQQKADSSLKSHEDSPFDLLLAKRHPEERLVQGRSISQEPLNSALASPVSQRAHESPISLSPDNACSPGTEHGTRHRHTYSSVSQESRYINPWSIARINASFQTPQRLRVSQPRFRRVTGDSPDTTQKPDTLLRSARPSSRETHELPSPPTPSLTAGSPVSRRVSIRMTKGSPEGGNVSVDSFRRAARERDRARYGNGALDTWFQRTTARSLEQDALGMTFEQEESAPSLSQLAEERFQSHLQSPLASSSTGLAMHEGSGNLSEGEGSSSRPRGEGNITSGRPDDPEASMDSGRGFPVLEKWAASLHKDFDSANQADLERALDFERRKKEANQRNGTRPAARDMDLDRPNSPAVESSPHRNRYLAAKAVLNGERPLTVESDTRRTLSPRDPRAYLMRHQDDCQRNELSADGASGRRLHTSKLPFERVPEGQNLHNICLPLPADLSVISANFRLTALHDSFTQSGTDTDAFSSSDISAMMPFWSQRLTAIIRGGSS